MRSNALIRCVLGGAIWQVLARFRPDLIGLLARLGAICFWLPTSLCQTLMLSLSCVTVCGLRHCCPARQAECSLYIIVYVCMYYMLVRLSGCLNHIKGTIIIIIIIIIIHQLWTIQTIVENVYVWLVGLRGPVSER